MSRKNFAGFLSLLGIVLSTALPSGSAQAEQRYGFANVSANYFTWSHTPQRTRDDFAFLEIEGGGGYDWGELYGFTDLENLDKSDDKYSMFAKGQLRYYLGKNANEHPDRAGFNVFLQGKFAAGKGWHEYSNVLGFGYNVKIGKSWFTPFIGALYTNTGAGFAGWNGGQLGWSVLVPFELWGQSFSVANWNEFDFARSDSYIPKGSSQQSWNGALSAWWNINKHWTTGVKYRYANDTLGAKGWTDGYVLTVKYDF